MEDKELTAKQRAFCLEYLKDFNGTQAAIRAGYSKQSANEQAAKMLAKVSIQNEIARQNAKVEKTNIMTIQEIQERLTAIARGESDEEVIVVEGTGDGCSQARNVSKKASTKEQVKALELLGKANAMFVDKVDANVKNENQELLKQYLQEVRDGKLNRN